MLRKHYQSLSKEAHDLPQAMALKAERCNISAEIHSHHTDGGGENTFYFVPPYTKSGLLPTVNIYRETLSLPTHAKYHGKEDHPI